MKTRRQKTDPPCKGKAPSPRHDVSLCGPPAGTVIHDIRRPAEQSPEPSIEASGNAQELSCADILVNRLQEESEALGQAFAHYDQNTDELKSDIAREDRLYSQNSTGVRCITISPDPEVQDRDAARAILRARIAMKCPPGYVPRGDWFDRLCNRYAFAVRMPPQSIHEALSHGELHFRDLFAMALGPDVAPLPDEVRDYLYISSASPVLERPPQAAAEQRLRAFVQKRIPDPTEVSRIVEDLMRERGHGKSMSDHTAAFLSRFSRDIRMAVGDWTTHRDGQRKLQSELGVRLARSTFQKYFC